MPELPEVETTVRDLNKVILGRKIKDVWFDFKKMIKKPKSSEQFKKEIKGKKIQKIWRRGKNILFDLSQSKTLLIHQKLTGHLLLGKWKLEKRGWQAKGSGPLAEDPRNRFLHLVFWLDDGRMLALSDLRKFAKVELWDSKKLKESEGLKNLGLEPLERGFTYKKFKEVLTGKRAAKGPLRPRSEASEPRQRRGKIKQVLMDQKVIAGIGNIYSDEILWKAKIHPSKNVSKLSEGELKRIYKSMQKILKKAIKVKGESISDFRRISGEKGGFDSWRKAYRRKGEKCSRCSTIIKRIKLAGRSAHFCPKCQQL